jgi:hypothetical protein
MTNELEQALIKQIREGDLSAAKVYSDYLEEQGKNKLKYVLRVPSDVSLTNQELISQQKHFKAWLNNELPLLIVLGGCDLVLLNGNIPIQVKGLPPSETVSDTWLLFTDELAATIGEGAVEDLRSATEIARVIRQWLIDNDCTIVRNSLAGF